MKTILYVSGSQGVCPYIPWNDYNSTSNLMWLFTTRQEAEMSSAHPCFLTEKPRGAMPESWGKSLLKVKKRRRQRANPEFTVPRKSNLPFFSSRTCCNLKIQILRVYYGFQALVKLAHIASCDRAEAHVNVSGETQDFLFWDSHGREPVHFGKCSSINEY